MDEAIEILSEALGPKWTNLYQRLGISDYRGRFQLQSKWKQKEPNNVIARNMKCSLEMLQKWRLSVQGRDEKESLEQLLNAVNEVKGFQKIANGLALRNGLQLQQTATVTASEASSDEYESTMSLEVLSKRMVIRMEDTNHKFAILDISQRLSYDKFATISKTLDLPDDLMEEIRGTKDLPEEQFYCLLKSWIQNAETSPTFTHLIKCLKACNEDHVVPYLLRRLKAQ